MQLPSRRQSITRFRRTVIDAPRRLRLWRSVRTYGTGERGGVTVAYEASTSYETAPRLLRALAESNPGITVRDHDHRRVVRINCLPDELCWLPLSPQVTFEVSLLVRSHNRSPAVDRMLDAATGMANALGWISAPSGHAGQH